jgi:murein DD-endopeptidase MepM/ murein hydrolase activator NlpD
MRKSHLNEDILGSIGSGLKRLLGSEVVGDIVDYVTDAVDDFDAAETLRKLQGLSAEEIPLRVALEGNPSKTALVFGSSQAGILGSAAVEALGAAGFKDFNYRVFPARSMADLYASIAVARNSNPEKYDSYDVVVIFPGFKGNSTIEDQIDSTMNIVDLFVPGRVFVVLPPPVTEIEDTFAAARSGINRGKPVSRDFWFIKSGGKYAADREEFRSNLKSAVDRAGATAVDPTDAVPGAFPKSPDGLHPSSAVASRIGSAVAEAVMSSDRPIPAASVVKTIDRDAIAKNPEVAQKFSDFPATSAALGIVAATGRTTSGFGRRKDPFTGELKGHQGIDIAVPVGTPVQAPLKGKIITVVMGHPKAGNFVEIQHDNGDVTRYLHLSDVLVETGDSVDKGEVFAKTGNTGRSTGPHLHWETWRGGGWKKGELESPKDWLAANTGSVKPVSFS